MEISEGIFDSSLPKIPVLSILENYGWYILLGIILLAYVYEKYIKNFLAEFRKKKDDEEYAAKYHKNPDLVLSRLQAQEKRNQQLQEQLLKAAEERKKKIEEKEKKKLEELQKLFEDDSTGGHTLGSNSKPLRTDYNPLMGHGGSSNYRPPRRSACSRGGCG